VPGSAFGLGPIQAAQAELRGAIDLSHYAGNFFNDSGIPTGILQSDLQLNKEQAALYKQAFKSSMAGKRDIAVLGMGLKYTPVFIKPADAQFLESKQYTTTEIARMFGTPSSLMLANIQGSSQTYQNVAQDWLGFIRFSNMQYLIEIEDALSDLLPMQRVAKFVTDDMTRTDTTTRYSEFETGLRAGFLHVDEVRRIEKLGPMPTTRTPAPATAPATAPDREDNE
jgi:HK97 family phage portal protein